MIVVADSGSTKTDWKFLNPDNGEIIYARKTIGFNPYFQDSEFITTELKKAFKDIEMETNVVSNVYFYGAGCSSEERCAIVEQGLKGIFSLAMIKVEHDLLGACRATLGNTPGIVGIIGTGSNSCVWDGENIVENIPSHGFILGDEGSGARLGQELLKLYFNNELPPSVKEDFMQKYKPVDNEIIRAVYQGKSPNVYLAGFAKFYGDHKDNAVLSDIVYEELCQYFYKRVIKYENCESKPLGFVGSIAFHFHDMLDRIADIHGMEVVKVDKCPIDGLVLYHAPSVVEKR